MTEKQVSLSSEVSGIDENPNLEKKEIIEETSKMNITPKIKGIKSFKDPLTKEEKEEYDRLLQCEIDLDEELAKLNAQLDTGPSMEDTMNALHEYNDIKDATQAVLGAMADLYGMTIASLHKEFDLPAK